VTCRLSFLPSAVGFARAWRSDVVVVVVVVLGVKTPWSTLLQGFAAFTIMYKQYSIAIGHQANVEN